MLSQMKTQVTLSREEFYNQVLKRDGYKCVICGLKESLAAHHILERWFWSDGGYYLDNGVSLCPQHHLEAERTEITCERLSDNSNLVL